MTDAATALATVGKDYLPTMLRQAAQKLAAAETAAEVLEARTAAAELYDEAKKAARLAKAKGAHDTVITTIYRVQADGLEIEAAAKRRLADEYDAAQAAGQAAEQGRPKKRLEELEKKRSEDGTFFHKNDVEIDRLKFEAEVNTRFKPATLAEMKMGKREIHDARQLRDAEARDPGVTKRTLDTLVEQGREPTRAAVRRELYPSKPKPIASDQSLWVWGRLCDFERKGILAAKVNEILSGMPPHMIADLQRIAPQLRNLLEEMEVALEHA